jgi:hypothetical protein
MVAYGFSSIILGVGVMLGYIDILYGTLTIILIADVARHLPIAFAFVRSLVQQVATELEEAARILAGRAAAEPDRYYLPGLASSSFHRLAVDLPPFAFSLCLRRAAHVGYTHPIRNGGHVHQGAPIHRERVDRGGGSHLRSDRGGQHGDDRGGAAFAPREILEMH